jgi:hypothetical protein
MCYVTCKDKEDKFCKVKEIRNLNGVDYISTPIGKTPPPYCNMCDNLFNFSLN